MFLCTQLNVNLYPLSRYEHSPGGGGGSSLWHTCPGGRGSWLSLACLGPVPHHQQGCDRLWERQKSKSHRSAEDYWAQDSGPPESCEPPHRQALVTSSTICWTNRTLWALQSNLWWQNNHSFEQKVKMVLWGIDYYLLLGKVDI